MGTSGTSLVNASQNSAMPAVRDAVRRAERLLAGENRLLELIATNAALSDVLDALACFIEAEARGMLCSILLLSDGRLRHGGAPSIPESYRLAIDGTEIGRDVGSCGHAAFTGEETIATDIATDRRWVLYRDLALRHGLRSCWSTPIRSPSGEILGTFAMYHHEPYEPTSEDRELVLVATHIAAIAIERARTDRALKEQAKASLAADQRKDEFLAMLAHELRGPLAPILNASQLLARETETASNAWRAAAIIERQTRHLMRLVDDLLDVSRITRDKISLKPVATSVEEILSRAIEMARPLAVGAGVELVAPPSSEPLRIQADPVRLTQAVFNVLNNAVKFTPSGGRVEIGARRDGSSAAISITDTGVGIAPELLPAIFDLFRQGEQSLDRSRGGLGIGLTVARRLVEMHGGRMSAESAGIGHGTKITVWVPLSAHAEDRVPEEPGMHASAARRRVLVVDDNVDGAEMVALGLTTAAENAVRVAHDGPTALATALEWHPDVVVLDIGLPGMDGFEVARRLRAGPEGDHPLLVALTGYGEESFREQSRRAGFDRHLVKPVAIEELARAIATPA